MYVPSYRVKGCGVPILNKVEIDRIGENFVRDYQPDILKNPAPVDIESFVEQYLGMTPDYQYLSHNGIYLGMTVFNDTDKVIVYSPETQKAEYISAKAHTVIIDNRLLEENQQHRYRFTLGHEGAHDILHSAYFSYDSNQMSMFSLESVPMIQCRIDTGYKKSDCATWGDNEWMEWQANRLSSAILMPTSAVRLVADNYSRDGLNKTARLKQQLVEETSNTFDVSLTAAAIRLKELGYLPTGDWRIYSMVSELEDLGFVINF